jgi:membrane-associated phospholipid phosphatase
VKNEVFRLQSTEYRHYRTAVLFSFLLWLVVLLFVIAYGKEESFLLINKYNSPAFDQVFRFWTFLGDGVIWVPLFLYTLLFRRKFFIAVLASVIICTVLTHFLKRVVFADEMRPVVVLGEDVVHVVKDLHMNRSNSFPSGHTSTAFTLALLMAFLYPKGWAAFFFPIVAFFVGYSRVYLSQHFVTDVCVGMLIGIISSWLSLLVFEKYRSRVGEKTTVTGSPENRP